MCVCVCVCVWIGYQADEEFQVGVYSERVSFNIEIVGESLPCDCDVNNRAVYASGGGDKGVELL